MKTLIKNGRLIDPASERDEKVDILVNGSLVEKIASHIAGAVEESHTIDATGLVVAPGLIDMHVHLREPGYEYKETIRTGSEAAVRGGFTTVVCMANTDPVNDNRSVSEFIKRRAQAEALCRVFPCGAITRGLKGDELSQIGEMFEAGVVALSDDGKTVKNAGLLLKAMEYAKRFGLPIVSHCEDESLAHGVVHEGRASLISGLDATPALAEEIIALRDIMLAKYVDAPIHITHASSGGTVRIVRDEKTRYGKLTADTCPHYFTLSDEDTLTYDTNTKVNPPLRSRDDVTAVKEGLKDGSIDIIATDHAPHDYPSKDVEFNLASFGIVGLETGFALSLSLVHESVLSLKELLRKFTQNPARLLMLPYGTLHEGSNADLIVFDPNAEWVVDKSLFASKGKNTPFHGRKLRGKNLLTIVDGKVVYRDPSF
ncbi:MAG TPA: dihydroorotase [Syntrophorhabdales bacterium]|nr:dihydroorotase [Syntrophorhabdales bacterium]